MILTEPPREPKILDTESLVSNTCARIVLQYDQTVRTKRLVLSYKEALYKGLSVKQWQSADIEELSKGRASITLGQLERGTMYRMFAKAENEFGTSSASQEVWFRTLDGEVEIRKT